MSIPFWAFIPVILFVLVAFTLLSTGAGVSTGGQLNTEYFFRLLYDCIHGGCYAHTNTTELQAFLAHLWGWIVIVGYILSIIGLFLIVYIMVRLFDLREREKEQYKPLELAQEQNLTDPRWDHIEKLRESTSVSDWRQAIIEADIMLDEMLTRQGYAGETLGEKLKNIESSDFATLQDAWEAHKVRNQIAHEGSAFELSETLARRTLARFESVFREFELI